MSRPANRCPLCGARIPAGMPYCNKCKADKPTFKTGRIATLSDLTGPSTPAPEAKEDRREEPSQLVKDISPEKRDEQISETLSEPAAEPRKGRKVHSSPAETERPAGKSRPPWQDEPEEPDDWYDLEAARKRKDRGTWKFITILAVIIVVVVIAVVLVIRLNEPTEEETVEYSGIRVITADGEDITPSETPAPTGSSEGEPEETADEAQTAEDDTSDVDTADGDIVIVEMDDTVIVTGVGVRLRSGPSTTYDVVATLDMGTVLQRTGRTTDGWSQVIYDDQVCYVSETLISVGSTDSVAEGDIVTVTSRANARTGPGTSYDVAAVLEAGTVLQRTDTVGSWSQVVYNGQTVYVNNNMLDAGTAGGTVTVNGTANIRSGPGTTYSVLGVVDGGTVLTVISNTGTGWYQVSYNDQTGYIAASMVTIG